jgi:hypothetical protein
LALLSRKYFKLLFLRSAQFAANRLIEKALLLVMGWWPTTRVARWFTYFQTKYPNLVIILEYLGMENVDIFYDHLEYFTAIWYYLWPFGIVCGHLVYFSRFATFGPREIWQPCRQSVKLVVFFSAN